MPLTYRDGRTADAEAIADLYGRCFTDTFSHLYKSKDLADFLATRNAEAFRAELDDPSFHFRLAEEQAALAGFLKLGPAELPVETPPGTIELRQLYVFGPWQGAGVAAALMDWAMARARSLHARHIQLNVYIDNLRAQRFYRRYGFEPVGRYVFMVGEHADEEIVMRASL